MYIPATLTLILLAVTATAQIDPNRSKQPDAKPRPATQRAVEPPPPVRLAGTQWKRDDYVEGMGDLTDFIRFTTGSECLRWGVYGNEVAQKYWPPDTTLCLYVLEGAKLTLMCEHGDFTGTVAEASILFNAPRGRQIYTPRE